MKLVMRAADKSLSLRQGTPRSADTRGGMIFRRRCNTAHISRHLSDTPLTSNDTVFPSALPVISLPARCSLLLQQRPAGRAAAPSAPRSTPLRSRRSLRLFPPTTPTRCRSAAELSPSGRAGADPTGALRQGSSQPGLSHHQPAPARPTGPEWRTTGLLASCPPGQPRAASSGLERRRRRPRLATRTE